MNETNASKSIAIDKKNQALIARPKSTLMDEEELKALVRLIDESTGAQSGVQQVIIDFSAVGLLASLALGLLMQISSTCKARGQKLKLAGVQPQLREVFTVTRLERLFEFLPTVEAAMQ